MGPSFMAFLENETDIEIVQDLEEENSKEETKKEFEENEKFVEKANTFELEEFSISPIFYSYYPSLSTSHIMDVHSPPPDGLG